MTDKIRKLEAERAEAYQALLEARARFSFAERQLVNAMLVDESKFDIGEVV